MKQVVIENHVLNSPFEGPYDSVGSARYVDFDAVRPTYDTRPDKCHIRRVAGDTESWKQKLAQTLEDIDEVVWDAQGAIREAIRTC
jgi:hypothetical protein